MYVSLISFPRDAGGGMVPHLDFGGPAAELTMQHQFFPFKLACMDRRPVVPKHVGLVLSLSEIAV